MPSVISQPSVTFSLASADSEVANAAQKVLIVGQYVTAGAGITDGGWEQNLGNAGEENEKFGRTSQLAAMVRAFKKIAPRVQLDVISLADATGTPRDVDMAVTGTATAAGTFKFICGSEKLHTISVAVASGDTANAVATAASAAINLDLDCPFTASVIATDTIQLRADNDGILANDLPVGHSGTVAGLAIAAPANGPAGATDPTLTSILDPIGNTRYQAIIWPYVDRSVVLTLLDARFNVSNDVLDGVAFTCAVDTKSNIVTDLVSGPGYNSQSLVFFADEVQTGESRYIGPAIAEAPYLVITYFAAIRAIRLTPDLPISQYVTTSAALDQFGGPAIASLPYFNTPIPQLPVPGPGRGFTDVEIEEIHDAGGSIVGQNSSGSNALVGEVTTTYLTDPASNADVTWKYLNYVDTASGAREYMHNNVKKRFAQSRLTGGAVTPGRDMANRLTIKAYLVQLYSDLASDAFALVQDGEAAITYFKDNITVTLDLALGKATVTMKLPIIVQLRIIVATVKIDFSPTS